MHDSGLPFIALARPEFLGMSMGEFQYPLGQKPLQEAIDETDLQKLGEKMYAAGAAIFQRMQELSVSPDGHQEVEAIRVAEDPDPNG